jgi:hypothetical protein
MKQRTLVLATLMSLGAAGLTAFQTPAASSKAPAEAAPKAGSENKAAGRAATSTDATNSVVQGNEKNQPDGTNRREQSTVGPGAKATLSGTVKDIAGHPVEGATITLTAQDGKQQSVQSGANGAYSISVSAAGTYDLVVHFPSAISGIRESMPLSGVSTRDFTLRPLSPFVDPSWTQTISCIIFLFLYFASVLLVTWHCVAHSVQKLLCAHIKEVETRLATEVDEPESHIIEILQNKVVEIKHDAKTPNGKSAIAEFLFWSRGRENAAWVALHEVERQIAARLAPPARVQVYLRSADADLRVIGKPSAITVADAIRDMLAADPSDGANIEAKKALLGRAISILSEDRDARFSTLMEWQNKASWLILAAILIIILMTAACGHAIFFLAGGAGGYLSRLMRALRREDVPLDYGASWTTLFLSPIFGALAAWFGIAMITLAADPALNLLGTAFKVVRWDDPSGPVTLAAAFLLGFSERWFDAVVGVLEKSAESHEAAKASVISAGAPPQQQPALKNAPGQPPTPPGPTGGGATIKLPPGPISPVQVVNGKIVLDKPADTDLTAFLTSDKPNYPVEPQALKLAKGQTEASFEIVPKGGVAAEEVRVTASINNVSISSVVKFE